MKRCANKTSDGRRCWRLPGHAEKCLIVPRAVVPADVERVMSAVRAARPDDRPYDVMMGVYDEISGRVLR